MTKLRKLLNEAKAPQFNPAVLPTTGLKLARLEDILGSLRDGSLHDRGRLLTKLQGVIEDEELYTMLRKGDVKEALPVIIDYLKTVIVQYKDWPMKNTRQVQALIKNFDKR